MLEFLTRFPARPIPVVTKVKSQSLGILQEEYLALSEKLNLGKKYSLSTAKSTMEITDFLVENGVELYDYDNVVTYMKAVARKAKKTLVWRALRTNGPNWNSVDYYKGINVSGIYQRPVPIEVLRNVDKLISKFGQDSIVFAVTDFEVPNPDPFIRVSCAGSENYIVFGMWDEPGYTLAHTQAASDLKKLTK